jgi:hypothetical protein
MTLTAPTLSRAPAPAPAQAQAAPLGLRINGRRKLLPLEFFCVLHGVSPRQAVEFAEDGKLWPAINFAVRDDGKRLIRLWRGAVESWEPDQSKSQRPQLQDVIARTLPALGLAAAEKVTIGPTELSWRVCVKIDTVASLVRAGELRAVASAGETPRITYLSVADFIQRRLLF